MAFHLPPIVTFGPTAPAAAAVAAPPLAGPLPPLLTPTTSLAQAVRGGTLGVGYAGGGFLIFYYLGVSKILHQLGIIKPGEVKTAGASAGVLAQGADHPGMPPHDEWIRRGIKFSNGCRADRNCVDRLDKHMTALIEEMVPPHAAASVSGRACGVVTWYKNGGDMSEGGYVCDYATRKDVVDALRVGTYVPGWSGDAKHIYLKGRPAFDGAFSQLLPCPPNVTYCIKIAALAPWDVSRSIEALLNPVEMSTTVGLTLDAIKNMLGPDPLQEVVDSIQKDKLNTYNLPGWMKLMERSQNPIADIYPGKFTRSPISPAQQLLFVLSPPTEETVMMLYRLGQADGRAWAKSVGWPTLR
ncbi:MAG: hypothetical protein J3K34DRAFT_398511 [Monoraphidium minutum]|nr:MAG: hypothetical protein J3K34DRAFT_398511 [Monoraphidium minutum]